MKTRLLCHFLCALGLSLGASVGCTNQNPDQLREKTVQEARF
ncbi:MAG TPA: hypothetical protein VMH04_15400 [Candidatus Solibacter sp.]|nr:hypothetical protein [Candidatus Solibacter sp.]